MANQSRLTLMNLAKRHLSRIPMSWNIVFIICFCLCCLAVRSYRRSKKNCIRSPVRLYCLKKIASVQPFDLTVQKNLHPFSRSTLLLEKKFASVQPLNPAVRKKFANVSYPFACRAFSRSNRCRKECFCVRGHKLMGVTKYRLQPTEPFKSAWMGLCLASKGFN